MKLPPIEEALAQLDNSYKPEISPPVVPQPAIEPTPKKLPPIDQALKTLDTQTPDMVNSIPDMSNIVTTEGFQPGHPAIDKAPLDPNQNVPMTNSIGGVPFSGSVTDPSGYYAGFGNYYGAIGASPAELDQMTPEEKAAMSAKANAIMSANPGNDQANSELATAFPGKNINFNAHLQDPVLSDPNGVATGSAQLTMGSTGNSSGKHTHQQFINIDGIPMNYEDALNLIRTRQYR